MDFKQVEYFLAVAHSGSFSSAADDLYLSQSSLSKQIIALENELKVTLFDRSKRKIILTSAGQAFFPHAAQIAAACQAMLQDIREYRDDSPDLAIVAIPVIAQYGIPAYIAQFNNRFPEVKTVLVEREAADILTALNTQHYNLALMRDNYLDPQLYDSVKICSDLMVAVISTRHPLAGRSTLSLAELANENFIMFDKGTVVHELAVEACQQAGFLPRIFYASLRIESVLSLIASNIGIAIMMKQIVDYHSRSDVVAIPLHEIIASNIVLAYPKNRKLSKPARAFVQMMKELVTNPAG